MMLLYKARDYSLVRVDRSTLWVYSTNKHRGGYLPASSKFDRIHKPRPHRLTLRCARNSKLSVHCGNNLAQNDPCLALLLLALYQESDPDNKSS